MGKASAAKHASPEERRARGRSARGQAPRSGHGDWSAAADRPDPIALLEQQASSRVPELVPIRYGRMAVSPFTFFRGAAYVMDRDLADTAVSGIRAQLCGDAHLSNFGVFGSPERRLLFDVNDFDETCPGPWEWDVKRLAASVAIAGRERAFTRKQRAAAIAATASEYREAMRRFAAMRNLDVWYARLDESDIRARLQRQAGLSSARRSRRSSRRQPARTARGLSRDSRTRWRASRGSSATHR